MAGREKQFDQNLALKNALDVFWAKGFEATSMQELVTAMGVNRASMYQTYGNKSELFIAAIEQYMQTSLTYVKETLEADGLPLGNIQYLVEQFIAQSRQNSMSGCFVGNSAVELGPHNNSIADKISTFWLQIEEHINNTLKRAVNQNQLDSQTDTIQLASLINSTMQGLLIKTKANFDKDKVSRDIDALFELIKRQSNSTS